MNAGEVLDISKFSRDAYLWNTKDAVDVAKVVGKYLLELVNSLARIGAISYDQSIGFAVAQPLRYWHIETEYLDDPIESTWFVGGWGPNEVSQIYNALRMLRPLLRENLDTLYIRIECPECFIDIAEPVDEDGKARWGDLPIGGAKFVIVGDWVYPVAVYGLAELDNDLICSIIGGLIGSEKLKIDKPKVFGPSF